MQIIVRDNNVEQALRALKKKLQREGVYREMKLRRHYEKPSEKRARERAAAIRRARKLERKRAEREGTARTSGNQACPSPKPPRGPPAPAGRSRCGWRS
jgi:small subunit ribosomal protein S21